MTMTNLRLVADYQLMSDTPARQWAEECFGHAKAKGLITEYEVILTGNGPFGLQYVGFMVTIPLKNEPFRPDMDHQEAREVGEAFLNERVVGDSDVSVRWAQGIA